jgi:hypothetical protein
MLLKGFPSSIADTVAHILHSSSKKASFMEENFTIDKAIALREAQLYPY